MNRRINICNVYKKFTKRNNGQEEETLRGSPTRTLRCSGVRLPRGLAPQTLCHLAYYMSTLNRFLRLSTLQAIGRFQRSEYVGIRSAGICEFTVEAREPSTEHRVTRMQFNEWLNRQGRSPRYVTLRNKIREAIGR